MYLRLEDKVFVNNCVLDGMEWGYVENDSRVIFYFE